MGHIGWSVTFQSHHKFKPTLTYRKYYFPSYRDCDAIHPWTTTVFWSPPPRELLFIEKKAFLCSPRKSKEEMRCYADGEFLHSYGYIFHMMKRHKKLLKNSVEAEGIWKMFHEKFIAILSAQRMSPPRLSGFGPMRNNSTHIKDVW